MKCNCKFVSFHVRFMIFIQGQMIDFLIVRFNSATARTVGHLSKSAEVMKLVNNLMKAPEVAATMQEFSKEMTKVNWSFSAFLLIFHNLYLVRKL